MIRNYLKIAWRNLVRNKAHSFINITGLAVGMAVAMLIGLWIFDELSFDKNHKNYGKIVRVMQNQTADGSVGSLKAMPIPVADGLRHLYANDFEHVTLSSWTNPHLIAVGDKHLSAQGNYMEQDAPEMLTLNPNFFYFTYYVSLIFNLLTSFFVWLVNSLRCQVSLILTFLTSVSSCI